MEKIKTKVNSLSKNISIDDEFEIMFGNYLPTNKISLIQFNNILKNMKLMKYNLEKNISLDVSLSTIEKKDNVNYRITINGLKNINVFVSNIFSKNNDMILDFILKNYLDKDFVEFIKKSKNRDNIYDDNDMDIRIRKSKEKKLSKQQFITEIKKNFNNMLYFRYKERMTANILTNNKNKLVLDATIIKSSDNIKSLPLAVNSYEVELDLTTKEKKISKSVLDNLYNNIINVKKMLVESDTIISNEESKNVLANYKTLVYGLNDNNKKFLYSMQPISIDLVNIIDDLPNKYSITDKADGEKYCLYIFNGNLYFISNNLVVKKTKYSAKNLDNTILEGEYIYIKEKQKYIFMIFDCLFFKGKDIRIISLLEERLNYINVVLDKLNLNKYYKSKKFSSKIKNINIQNKLQEYYTNEMTQFYKLLDTNIDKSKKNDIIFYPKLFIHPMNLNIMNVYMYSYLIWNNCTKNKKVLCPYELDGIIYTGLNQKYTSDKREHKYPIYKYKPPETNSIDVYVRFKKNKNTNKDYIVFDNTVAKDTEFVIVELMVGDNIGNTEIPSPFLKKEKNHIAYFPLKDGYIRDVEGNIVISDTVIEITYNHLSNLPHQYRWNILRTRWDKTESVNRFKKKYGNYKTVAASTWETIKQAVTINDMYNLSLPDKYLVNKNNLLNRLGTVIRKKPTGYFQKKSNLGYALRQFTNWVKSVLIYTYCGKYDMKKTVLDIGFGRGADILKYFYAQINELVAIDYDYDALYSTYDSASKRYKQSKHMPGFPKMDFIQADCGSLLTLEDQKKAIPNYAKESSKIFNKVLNNKKFDVIVSNLAIHYMFRNDESVKNLFSNFNTYLKSKGYVVLTLFDGDLVMDILKGNNKYTSYRIDEEGNKVKYYEIIKKFPNNKLENKSGNAIDVYMSWFMEEGNYQEEYLISKKYMIDIMKKNNMSLVETDTLKNVYMLNKDFFKNTIKYESNPKNKKVYENFSSIYDDKHINDRNWMFLYRYYVFRKN